MNLDLHQRPRQGLQLSQTQLQSLELLQLSGIELKQAVKKEYLENPMIECLNPDGTDDSVSLSYGKSYREHVDLRCYQEIPAPAAQSIRDFILEQLPQSLKEEDRSLAEYMIGCLEPNGFFTMRLSELREEYGCSMECVVRTLRLLKGLEPCGIFSENLRECLLRQYEKKGSGLPLDREILAHHLEQLLQGKISSISRECAVSTSQVRQALERISELEPNPLHLFSEKESEYIEPDILLQNTECGWELRLNDGWIENYCLNDYYLRMMRKTEDPELRSYFQEKLRHARLLFRNIRQRRSTLLQIGHAVLKRQRAFLCGTGELSALTMTELAEELDIHVSTVSRALKNKYLSCPRGTILLKTLFSSGFRHGEDDAAVSPAAVKEKIRSLIAAEDKQRPLSDQAVLRLLQDSGIALSRRAVAKYRAELGIPGSSERRERNL